MTIIPETGRPADLNVKDIKSPADAHRALIWLAAVLSDMRTQVKDRATQSDELWLKRLRAAERNTTNLRHRILEVLDGMKDNFSVHEAIVTVLLKTSDESFIEDLANQVAEAYPYLEGFDISSLKGPAIPAS